jgi:arylsulfatase A-like enzyme/Tfp pilus assembly protein PilF
LSRSARYTFILVVVALSGCLAAFGGWRYAKASAPVNGPIILISIDSLRADHLPAYGYENGKTPALDALVSDSVVFERAYAHVPQTLPAHSSMLTGRLPFETGVRDVAGYALPETARTIAELLRDRGYTTGGIVSSFLLRKETGIARGFTFFDAELPKGTDASLTRDGAESERIAEHWLDSIGTSRALLFLHLSGPGTPFEAPDRYSEAAATPYDAEISYADEVVGRLIRYLKSHQLYDRSTIVVVSDHGEGLGDHGEAGHGLLAYEEALHVPLIVKQPGGDGRQHRVKAPVQQIDIVPTILDLAKAPGASGLRGRSLVPALAGNSLPDAPIYAESLYGEYRFGWAPVLSLIDGRYQLVTSGTRDELFDLSVPAAERHDLASEKADIVAASKKRLAEFTPRGALPKPASVTQSDRERFESLGYVGVPGTVPEPAAERSLPADHVRFVENYRKAVDLARANEAKSAIDAFRALTRQQPRMPDVWLHLARTAARSERQDIALEAFRSVLNLEPDNVAAHLGAAASSLRARKLDETALHAQWVLEALSTDKVQKAEAHELLARVAFGRKDLELARSEAEAAEALDPQRPVVSFIAGRVALDEARYGDAVEQFENALAAADKAARPPLADLRVYAAEALIRVERSDAAERLLAAELLAFPANVRARITLQSLYRATGRPREAAALAQH